MTIEQLVERARRLGLLETIHVGGHQQALGGQPAGSSAATNGSGESDQHMLYAIVIDFEATCWPQKSLRQPEIIGKQSEHYELTKTVPQMSINSGAFTLRRIPRHPGRPALGAHARRVPPFCPAHRGAATQRLLHPANRHHAAAGRRR